MLVDDITLKLEAGSGGKGAIAFNKVRLMQGPVGGDGGDGGSIYAEGVLDVNALSSYTSKKTVSAPNGKNGHGQFVDGKDGKDIILTVPTGTRIKNLDTGSVICEIERVGERVLLVKGGKGGRGNFKFRSSTNTTPYECEEGSLGEAATFQFELRLIADVGLVGLPNAGKSSLLNHLTAAKSKVGNYAFTTLEPHLGAYYEIIIADIPGLIEGASSGRGLGVKFLKHIERTKTLFHLVSAESENPVRDYRIVRRELEAYDTELAKKEEHVFVTKSDAVTAAELQEKLSAMKDAGITVTPVSIIDDKSINEVKKALNDIKAEK